MSDFSESTVFDGDVDVVNELEIGLFEIQEACENKDIDRIMEKVTFLKFLVAEIKDIFKGELADLKYRRFITKKDPEKRDL